MDKIPLGVLIVAGLALIALGGVVVYTIKHEDECPRCHKKIKKGPLQECLLGYYYKEECPCGWEHQQFIARDSGSQAFL